MTDTGTEYERREELAEVCREIYHRHLVSSSGGNASIRLEDGFLITPTGVSLGRMTAERLVKVDFGGVAVGSGKPSKEVAFHLHAYSVRSDVSAVLHLHSPYSVCLSCMLAKEPFPIPAMTPGYAIRVGRLPMIPLMIPGSAQLAAAVREVIAVGDCVLLAKHGVVVVGKDLEGALNIAEEIEENAKIFVLGGARAAGLTDEEVASVRKAFALKVY